MYKSNYLPRQVWFLTPSQSEVLWELPAIDQTTAVKAADFAPPAIPKGWKERVVPASPVSGVSAKRPHRQ